MYVHYVNIKEVKDNIRNILTEQLPEIWFQLKTTIDKKVKRKLKFKEEELLSKLVNLRRKL